MGSMYKGLLQGIWLPQLRFIRNKHKHNITKPRLPHFERHVVEQVCMPYFLQKKKPQYIPNIDACDGGILVPKKHVIQPYVDIVAKEAFDKVRSSKLIGFFHLNTFDDDVVFQSQVLLKKNGMKYVYYNKTIITQALTGTEYEPVLQLFKGYTLMATSAELELSKLLKTSKKMHKLTLMAALVEDRLLSSSELKYYGQYENLDSARLKLLHTLNSASQGLVQQINQHPNTFVQCLNLRMNDLKSNSAKS